MSSVPPSTRAASLTSASPSPKPASPLPPAGRTGRRPGPFPRSTPAARVPHGQRDTDLGTAAGDDRDRPGLVCMAAFVAEVDSARSRTSRSERATSPGVQSRDDDAVGERQARGRPRRGRAELDRPRDEHAAGGLDSSELEQGAREPARRAVSRSMSAMKTSRSSGTCFARLEDVDRRDIAASGVCRSWAAFATKSRWARSRRAVASSRSRCSGDVAGLHQHDHDRAVPVCDTGPRALDIEPGSRRVPEPDSGERAAGRPREREARLCRGAASSGWTNVESSPRTSESARMAERRVVRRRGEDDRPPSR